MAQIRKNLRSTDSTLIVGKNQILRKAVQDLINQKVSSQFELPLLYERIQGKLALIFTNEEIDDI